MIKHRWLFLIEGLITLSVGVASFFMMPASAVQTKQWFRPKGWFSDRETVIVVNRVLRDDPSKGDMHNRQAVTPKRLWNALKDYDMWPVRSDRNPDVKIMLTAHAVVHHWPTCVHSTVRYRCLWLQRTC